MKVATYIVVPCYNEAQRLDKGQVEALLTEPDVGLIFVDDGSTDATGELLNELKNLDPARIELITLARNGGKAEAVRAGLLHAISLKATLTGYLDADFATPAKEMLRLVSIIKGQQNTDILLAARWLHLGSTIERKFFRHYAGRIFATIASMVLNLRVYDTQCGAKLMRVSPGLKESLSLPFLSRWAFDVELLGRLRRTLETHQFLEVPLQTWIDVPGSKLSLHTMLQATLELGLIWRALKKYTPVDSAQDS